MRQSHRLIPLTQRAQQAPHQLRLFFCRDDFLQGGIHRQPARLDTLQQTARKQTTTLRPLRVDPAKLSIKTSTRLAERHLRPGLLIQGQPESLQPLRVVTRTQLHIRKQRAVAAQAAVGTKRVNAFHTSEDSSPGGPVLMICLPITIDEYHGRVFHEADGAGPSRRLEPVAVVCGCLSRAHGSL